MTYEVESGEIGRYIWHILPDQHPTNPREWSNACLMACRHRRYRLGDDGGETALAGALRAHWKSEEARNAIATDPIGFALEHFDQIERAGIVAAVLYLYDHSGITIRASWSGRTPFSSPWDSGIVGLAFVTREIAEREWSGRRNWRAWARRIIEIEVETYDAYLTGNVSGFRVDRVTAWDEDGEPVEVEDGFDSCWGFYPDSRGEHMDAKMGAIAAARWAWQQDLAQAAVDCCNAIAAALGPIAAERAALDA